VPAPVATLETRDAIGVIVGMVIGAGIFTLPSLVAQGWTQPRFVLGLWLAGGLLSFVGALCYAELASAYPDAGGDYFFVQRAYGRKLAFLYAWARLLVITSGATAFLGFTFGDYMSKLVPLGAGSSSIYAALSIIVSTGINLAGIRQSKATQNTLTAVQVAGVVAIIVAGLWLVAPAAPASAASLASTAHAASRGWAPAIGHSLVFVLFAYGGWNEAAYISAELKQPRSLVTALIASLCIITSLYLLLNLACIRGLSLAATAASKTVVADLLARAFGAPGALLISLLVALSALTSINATVIVGARSSFALGRDFALLGWLGRWDEHKGTPSHGLLVQCAVSLALVAVGHATRQGLQTVIDYTAPVFWFFFLLVGVGLLVLRAREPARPRPFKVPLYPLTPLLFCGMCTYLLYSSLAYAQTGALVGVGVVVLGLGPLALNQRRVSRRARVR
jgi:basic amino acid/polyamine antiporter, APA family